MPIPAPFKARATLLERLTDYEPRQKAEPHPLRVLSREGLKESVRRNLDWILNARTPLTGDEFDHDELTVIHYGIPDFGGYSPENPEDRKRLARRIRRAVRFFEPRLRDVRVTVGPQMENERTLRVIIIHAVMVEADIREPVIFKTILQG
ncbi:type VI secretion system baseplate subunit TssE [Desulfonema ishimotonii]|uniref:Type VI secretion system baseplate subunit TssE n=1 Tax=Desulfonema ishimotonii TaxID=45657 RepID=A0A401FYU4_9BACT|nr:type VI secretion system baseplate subunit TssE [Desulfonema ishimotonii]GBC62141.1 type VI secretion system baseplate subunit TssE [Desulfonema ishimotonii]